MTTDLARRVLTAWLALELAAGILALALLVATLPLVLLAVPDLTGRAVPQWALVVGSLATALPLAALLGREALRLPREVSRL